MTVAILVNIYTVLKILEHVMIESPVMPYSTIYIEISVLKELFKIRRLFVSPSVKFEIIM